jgi:hypothetical protein
VAELVCVCRVVRSDDRSCERRLLDLVRSHAGSEEGVGMKVKTKVTAGFYVIVCKPNQYGVTICPP